MGEGQTQAGGLPMNLYRVRTAITGGPGGSELATMYFDASTGTAQDAANAARAFWVDCAGQIKSIYTMTVLPLVYTIDSTTDKATSVTGTTTTAVPGGSGADGLPTATQGLIRWHTGVFSSGREIQGKTFIPGMVVPANNQGVPTSALLTALQTAATNLASAGPITFGVYSRKHHLFAQATTGSPWNQWAVLRSRRT